MKRKLRTVKTRFGPETRFEIGAVPAVPFRGTLETDLEQLKKRLLLQLLVEHPAQALNAPFRRAANEAASLAWFTPFPLLMFPALLEEKAREAQLQTLRQGQIRQRSLDLMELAAA